eukprot:m.89120 g.89120  ORF g.89120 m.89120 type:complete len:234 (+) comp8825_c1_seq1:252-953(+)
MGLKVVVSNWRHPLSASDLRQLGGKHGTIGNAFVKDETGYIIFREKEDAKRFANVGRTTFQGRTVNLSLTSDYVDTSEDVSRRRNEDSVRIPDKFQGRIERPDTYRTTHKQRANKQFQGRSPRALPPKYKQDQQQPYPRNRNLPRGRGRGRGRGVGGGLDRQQQKQQHQQQQNHQFQQQSQQPQPQSGSNHTHNDNKRRPKNFTPVSQQHPYDQAAIEAQQAKYLNLPDPTKL